MNKNPLKKYIYPLALFSVVIATLGMLFQWLAKWYSLQIASPAIPFIIIFFFCITFFTFYIVFRKQKQVSEKKFIFKYMLSRVIKITAILLFLVLYIIFNKEDRWNFAGAFLLIYFSYSIFEIVTLKRSNEKPLQ